MCVVVDAFFSFRGAAEYADGNTMGNVCGLQANTKGKSAIQSQMVVYGRHEALPNNRV